VSPRGAVALGAGAAAAGGMRLAGGDAPFVWFFARPRLRDLAL